MGYVLNDNTGGTKYKYIEEPLLKEPTVNLSAEERQAISDQQFKQQQAGIFDDSRTNYRKDTDKSAFGVPTTPDDGDTDGGGGGGGGTGDGGGGGGGEGPNLPTPPPGHPDNPGPNGTYPWRPTGYGDPNEDPFLLDTRPPPIPGVPETDYYAGDGGPNVTTDPGDGTGTTVLNPDGSVRLGAVDPTTREVQPGELVEERLSGLLGSDSKFIQDARRQGLEQANALGGLGGSVGAGASMQAAIRAGLPIAQADAATMTAAAAQNMDALNNFGQLNLQRATQLELTQIDARTRQQITQIGTSAQMAAARLQSANQRDIAFADNATKLQMAEMSGQIQDRLARFQFEYNSMLLDQETTGKLQNTALSGKYSLEQMEINRRMNEELAYLGMVTGSYDTFMERIANLNGLEMDDAARQRATGTIVQGYKNIIDLINSMYPDRDPIRYDNPFNGQGQQDG